jgi:2-oxoglutarate dehydrogenase E2 component (dihydrolipoamide succinyltransferase)
MAAVPITVPSVGESISEGILSSWLKPDGASVKAGDPLFELETDKTNQVVVATAAGTLKHAVAEGATVAIGSVVGSVDPSGAPAAEAPATGPATASAPAASSANGGSAATSTLAPSVRRLVAETNVDPGQIEGTGRGGRLTKGDVLTHLAAPPAATTPPPPSAMPTIPPLPSPAPVAVPSTNGHRETRKRMSGIRQTIAKRLVEAQQTAAMLTTFNEADMTRVMDLRAKYKETFQKKHGVGLGFMSFFVKATVEALKAFPNVNGRIDGQDIITHHYVNIGVAVSTERGLMVPVLRDADAMSFAAIEKAIGAYAVKAREGTIALPDLQGGTFTITNGGVFGSLLSTPILNPPQSGILGMHAIQKRPVAVGDEVVIRPMMYLALSYDHRIVDGREAVSFLVRIKECIENPERLMLEV